MRLDRNTRLALAPIGEVRCDGLIEAMRAEGWDVVLARGLEELLVLSESGEYHMAVVACEAPEELSVPSVRALMSLQTEISVMFLVPDCAAGAGLPALMGATSDQLHDLDTPPAKLIEIFKVELRSVFSVQVEYVVMCVDDDEEFLRSLEALLPDRLAAACPRFALDFEFFVSPLEALEAAEGLVGGRLAVVICDEVMPRMSGIELLGRLKQLDPAVKRVLLTGQAGLGSAVDAINKGVLDKYFFKPIEEPVDFANSIRLLLRGYCHRLRADAERRRLMSQFEYIRAITSAPTIEKGLDVTVQFLREQASCNQVTVALREDDALKVRAGVNLPGDLPVGAAVWREDGLCAWVLRHRRPILAATQRELPCRAAGALGRLPLMAVPLVYGDRALGVIVASGRRGNRPFSRDERMLMSFVADAASVTIGGLRDRQSIEQHYVATMSCLMETVEAKDGYTRGHTDRVTALAVALAKAAGVADAELENIRRAASLHDIGKIAVPDRIMSKPAALDRREYAVMKEHPARGDKILQHLKFLDSARMIVRSHHERYDGKGYPDGLKGEEIPLGARILAVVDSYDAMTSARPYREAMEPPEALAEIEVNARKQFDPKLVPVFFEMMKDVASRGEQRAAESPALAAPEDER